MLWEFCTNSRDVRFQVEWVGRQTMESVHPARRVKSHCLSQAGHFTAPERGQLTLTWDNSYSRLKSKELYYQVHTVSGPVPTLALHAERLERDKVAVDTVHSLWEVAVEQQKQRDNPEKSKARAARLRAPRRG